MLFLNKSQKYYKDRAKKIQSQKLKWQIQKKNLQIENQIRDQYKQITQTQTKQKIATSKLLLFLFIGICTLAMLFTGWATIESIGLAAAANTTPDLTPMMGLLGSIIAPIIPILGYYYKSTRENCKGGIIYDSALGSQDDLNEDENGVG